MKQCLFLFIACLSLYACNEPATKESAQTPTVDSSHTEAATIVYPYAASYSSKFEMGNPHNVRMVLDLWKHWDNNTLEQAASFFADSVRMQFHDGHVVHTVRDSIMAIAKKERGKYAHVTSSVIAFTGLKSVDQDEEWVCIWGKEVTETAAGKKDSLQLQENWRLDKNGKIAQMVQFAAKPWKE